MASTGSRAANGHASNGVVVLPADASADRAAGDQKLSETLPATDRRIIVSLPDGTVLTLIGVPSLLIAVPDWIGASTPQKA